MGFMLWIALQKVGLNAGWGQKNSDG